MDTPSPYQTPHTQMPPQPPRDVPDVMLQEPGAIKTFGVLHLVIAGYGMLMGIISLVSTVFFQGLSKNLATPRGVAGPSGAEQEMAMMSYMNELKTYTYASLAFSFALAVMLIIAGIGLLKGREKGRVMSIRYAWASLAAKLVGIVMTVAIVMPATKRMTDTLYQGMPGGMANTMGSVMQYSQLFGLLITCTYPIVVLVVMKGQKIKEYMAARAAA
jgi:hypothetical protein